jgi:acyl dehydratase
MADVDWRDSRITDEGIDYIRSCVGKKSTIPTWNRQVTKDGIEHFALGIGDNNPLWWDDAYAQNSPWGKRVAPPCYLYSHTRAPRMKPSDGIQTVEAYLPGVLAVWAGEYWKWNRLPAEGDEIRGEAAVVDVSVGEGRFGGRTVTHVERDSLVTREGEVVAEVDTTLKRFERNETRSRRAYLDRPLARYTDADRQRFADQYESEAAARRGNRPRYVEDVRIGDRVGPLLKGPLTITNIVGWLLGGGSNLNPTNRMLHDFGKLHPPSMMLHPETGVLDTIEAPHWEPVFAKESGIPTGYDIGCMRISWFSHLITDWGGDHALLKELQTKIVRPNLMGDVTWVNGEVVAIEETGDRLVSVKLTATNQLDEVTTTGLARVKLPRKQKGGK